MIAFFSKKSVGIDIADRTIEVVSLVKKGMGLKIFSRGRVLLPAGVVKAGRIKDEEKLSKALKKALAKAKPKSLTAKKIIFGLPESQVYIHVFELDPHDRAKRDELILKQVQANIPLEKDDIIFSYQILEELTDKVEILLVAASREAIQEWQQFFQKLDLEVEIFDIESLAIFRGLFTRPVKTSVCVVDIGAATTKIAIFDKTGLRYSRLFRIAGNAFSKQIAKTLKIDFQEAEKRKIKSGLSNKNSQIFSLLVEGLESISREIKTLLAFFNEKTGQEIKEIILVGGSSKLKGIVDYLSINLGLSVKMGKSKLLKSRRFLEYIGAIGLALRGIDKRWSRDPAFVLDTPAISKPLDNQQKKKGTSIVKKFFIKKGSVLRPEKSQKKKLILLLVIVLVGGAIIGLALWYQNERAKGQNEEQRPFSPQFTETQLFSFKIPVSVLPEEYVSEKAKGRLVKNTIMAVEGYEEALIHSRTVLEESLSQGEKLWPEPIDELSEEQAVKFPLTVRWFIYSQPDLERLVLQEIDKLNKDNFDYILSETEVKDIELIENVNIINLLSETTIFLNQLIELGEVETDKEEETMVMIEETETGWLRVREGPDITYSEIDRIYPGESYPLLEEITGWYKIKLGDEKEGWISSRYASLL